MIQRMRKLKKNSKPSARKFGPSSVPEFQKTTKDLKPKNSSGMRPVMENKLGNHSGKSSSSNDFLENRDFF